MFTNSIELLRYHLVNTATNKRVRTSVLTAAEKSTLNYAYALNGSPLRWETI